MLLLEEFNRILNPRLILFSKNLHKLILHFVKKNPSLFFLFNVLTSKIAGDVPAHTP